MSSALGLSGLFVTLEEAVVFEILFGLHMYQLQIIYQTFSGR